MKKIFLYDLINSSWHFTRKSAHTYSFTNKQMCSFSFFTWSNCCSWGHGMFYSNSFNYVPYYNDFGN